MVGRLHVPCLSNLGLGIRKRALVVVEADDDVEITRGAGVWRIQCPAGGSHPPLHRQTPVFAVLSIFGFAANGSTGVVYIGGPVVQLWNGRPTVISVVYTLNTHPHQHTGGIIVKVS